MDVLVEPILTTMYRVLIILAFLFVSEFSFSQSSGSIAYYYWSDPMTYKRTRRPLISAYGPLSDSLSNEYDGNDFFEHNDTYYQVNSWADYYLWFTKEYWWQFNHPVQYEFFYYAKDNLGMVTYLATNFVGTWYPAPVKVNFLNHSPNVNKICNPKYHVKNSRQLARLNRELENPPKKNTVKKRADLKFNDDVRLRNQTTPGMLMQNPIRQPQVNGSKVMVHQSVNKQN